MNSEFLLAMPSMPELLVILAIVLILFGGSAKIPQLMGSFGKGIKNFKKSLKEDEEEENSPKKIDKGSDS